MNIESQLFTIGPAFLEAEQDALKICSEPASKMSGLECGVSEADHHSHGALEEALEMFCDHLDDLIVDGFINQINLRECQHSTLSSFSMFWDQCLYCGALVINND